MNVTRAASIRTVRTYQCCRGQRQRRKRPGAHTHDGPKMHIKHYMRLTKQETRHGGLSEQRLETLDMPRSLGPRCCVQRAERSAERQVWPPLPLLFLPLASPAAGPSMCSAGGGRSPSSPNPSAAGPPPAPATPTPRVKRIPQARARRERGRRPRRPLLRCRCRCRCPDRFRQGCATWSAGTAGRATPA